MANYSQWWESFAGGEWDESTWGAISPSEGSTNYLDRTRAFYSDVVGPSWGYEGTVDDPGFGDIFDDYIGSFDLLAMQKAEEAFRMSTGDIYRPTGGATDPFGWERLSRMSPSEAQAQLAGELYGQGDILGGTTGTEYGTSMAMGTEAYTSGLQAEREKLTYEGLTGSQSIASGTSGSVLRTSAGITQSEDILAEAYKKAKTLGGEYKEGQVTTELDLKANLDDALTTYLDAIDDEKERWFNNVMGDVQRAKDQYGADLTGTRETQAYLDPEGGWDVGETYWGEGEPPTGMAETGAACGVGELFNPDTGLCELAEDLDLSVDQYGVICPGTVDECGVCDGDGADECGVCGGTGMKDCFDGTTACDCMTYEEFAESWEGFVWEGFGPDWGLDSDFDLDPGAFGWESWETGEDEGGGTDYIYGCTAPSALNYDPEATMSNGTCIYPEEEDGDNNDGYVSCGNQGDCPYWAPWCIGGQCSVDPENPAGTGAGGPQM